MREVIAVVGQEIPLGRYGEHLATCVRFDISEWVNTYGEGTAQLLHRRNGDSIPYPCDITQEGGVVTWVITQSDVDVAGNGLAELNYFVNDALVKSERYDTMTERSLYRSGEEAPEPYKGWMDNMLKTGSEAAKNADRAEAAAWEAHKDVMLSRELLHGVGVKAPTLGVERQAELFDLMEAWRQASRAGKIIYSFNCTRNSYVAGGGYSPFDAKNGNRVRLSCDTLCLLVWAGVHPDTFVGKETSYDGTLQKAFDWGYQFQFPSRKLANVKLDSTGKAPGFYQPNPDSLEGAYSYNSYYYYDKAAKEYKEYFRGFMSGSDMAQELFLLGCEVPLSEVQKGDMVFFEALRMGDGKGDEAEAGAFRNISHLGLVHDTSHLHEGMIGFLECTDVLDAGATTPVQRTYPWESLKTYFSRAINLESRIVMVARHPSAFGIVNPVPEKFERLPDGNGE